MSKSLAWNLLLLLAAHWLGLFDEAKWRQRWPAYARWVKRHTKHYPL